MTRRSFVAAASLGVGAAAAPIIRSIETLTVNYPVTSYFRFFTKPARPAVFVKVTCDGGVVGWGQSVPTHTWSYETVESVETAIRSYLAPALLGKSAVDISGAHQVMNRAIAPSFSTGMPIAKAGVDLALHDIAGKVVGQPVAGMWGRKPLERITISWTVNARTLDEASALVEGGRKRGYKHFNIKVAPDPVFDVALAKLVRRLAPNSFLWADANGGYEPATAMKVARQLADAGVDVFEQPVAANRLTAFRDLKRLGALPILMDEGVVSSTELLEFMRLGLLDGVAMKPARTAGLWDARRQVEILRDAGMMVLGSGLTDPDVSLAASLALYGAYGVQYPCALNGLQFLTGSYLKKPFELEEGTLRVPTGPGLGVTVNEQAIRKAAA
ncbi:MAG: mandelate racemase [Bryobacterales bacterium]|nr:mandelate racemase [Bryobacterales bacterium]